MTENTIIKPTRQNLVELSDGNFIVRTQAGWNKLLKKLRENGYITPLIYPGSYPAVAAIDYKSIYLDIRLLTIDRAIREAKEGIAVIEKDIGILEVN